MAVLIETTLSSTQQYVRKNQRRTTSHIEAGNRFLAAKLYRAASESYHTYLQEPDLTATQRQAVLERLAKCYGYLGDPENLERVLAQLDPTPRNDGVTDHYRGLVAYRSGALEEAVNYFTKAEANPDYAKKRPFLTRDLLFLHQRRGEYRQWKQKADTLKGSHGTAQPTIEDLQWLVYSYLVLYQKSKEVTQDNLIALKPYADKLYELAQKNDASITALWQTLGVYYAQLADLLPTAEDEVLARQIHEPELLFEGRAVLGEIHKMIAEAFDRILLLAPDNEEAYYALALYYRKYAARLSQLSKLIDVKEMANLQALGKAKQTSQLHTEANEALDRSRAYQQNLEQLTSDKAKALNEYLNTFIIQEASPPSNPSDESS